MADGSWNAVHAPATESSAVARKTARRWRLRTSNRVIGTSWSPRNPRAVGNAVRPVRHDYLAGREPRHDLGHALAAAADRDGPDVHDVARIHHEDLKALAARGGD